MAYQATVIPVMIASPGDVSEQREVAREVIHSWNYVHSASEKAVLIPVGWETHSSPELSGRPQELINDRVLSDCDLLVGIFWTRLGTPTGVSISGTAEEIERHLAAGKPAMTYFSTAPVAPQMLDQDQFAALTKFRKWCQEKGLVWTFDSKEDFRLKFDRQLRITLEQNSHLRNLLTAAEEKSVAVVDFGSHTQPPPPLTVEARELLLEASLDPQGQILHLRHLGGEFIQTNTKTFGGDDVRAAARWKHALEQLEAERLIRATGVKRQIFELTHLGFEAAERLQAGAA